VLIAKLVAGEPCKDLTDAEQQALPAITIAGVFLGPARDNDIR
jgi:hypothetical protein